MTRARPLLLCVMILLAGCVTPYGPQSIMGGYKDYPIGDNRHHIQVMGNNWSTLGPMEEYFHRRANEMAQERGFDGYTVVSFRVGMEPYGLNVVPGVPTASGVVEFHKGMPSVQAKKGTGTGFFVADSGLILTAHHVIKGVSKIVVHAQVGQPLAATVEQVDPANDLALLSVKADPPAFLTLAPSRSAKTGQRVFTMGFPLPAVLGQEPKYTEGVISALSGIEGASSLLQTTVPMQPGNSGGPLLNERGEVVGVVTSSAAVQYFLKMTGTLPQNVNWAIKAEYAKLLFNPPNSPGGPKDSESLLDAVKKSLCLIEVER
jgi:S1-C subfamily serine protease